MTVRRWGVLALAMSAGWQVLASCKSSPPILLTSSSSSNVSSTGVGTGGNGGSVSVSSSSSGGSGGSTVDAGPIVCTTQYTTIPDGGPCDLLNQDCPVGQTCEPTQNGSAWTTGCVATPGLKTAGEDCYTPYDCDAKLVCIGLELPIPGTCVSFCCNDGTNRPCNGGACNNLATFDTGITAYTCDYGKQCELLTEAPCPSGFGCHIDAAAGPGIAVCLEPSPDPVALLGACQYINDCGNMQQCYPPGAGYCLYYCALTGSKTGDPPGLGGCPTGQTCQSTYAGQPISLGVNNIGLCVPNGGLGGTGGGSSAASSSSSSAASSSVASSSSSSSSSHSSASSSVTSSSSGTGGADAG